MSGSLSITTNVTPPRLALGLVGWIVSVFMVAAIGGFFAPGEWYATLRKPSWTPPGWLFGPVWTLLYLGMAVAAWMVWKRGGFARQRYALSLFGAQLLLNALWSPLFFGWQRPDLAFLDILVLDLVLFATVLAFWRIRSLAGVLLIPYLVWVLFASFLNFTIWKLNA